MQTGYTILGETVGQGFDLLSLFSGFLGGGAKKTEDKPSKEAELRELRLREGAQQAQASADRAKAAGWGGGVVVGG